MAGKTRHSAFRHPDTVAHLQSLTDDAAADHPPLIRKTGGIPAAYWHEGGREAVAACVSYVEANSDQMRCDLFRKPGLPGGPGVVESACKWIVGNRSSGQDAAGRKRAPTLCSP